MAKMFIGGEWQDRDDKIPVYNPYDGSVVDTVPNASKEDVDLAFKTAEKGAAIMKSMSGHDRYLLLKRAAEILVENEERIGRTITLEEGKTFGEGKLEASRAVETVIGASEEAKRLSGETIPLDGAPGSEGKFGFTMRVPCGIVVGITPFNFPFNLVAHKAAPALAAGNAVIIKPATDTPLSALLITELFIEAGIPAEAMQCITGKGAVLGNALCSDPRARKITFTGSRDVGETICNMAGIKKVTMELGSNSPIVVLPDADLAKVAKLTASTGFSNAGQVCISAQRVLVDSKVYGDYLDALKEEVEAIVPGNPFDEDVTMGPMIREKDSERVNNWIKEAESTGARVLTGGSRTNTLHEPTVVADVAPTMKISCEEIFGPAVGVTPTNTIEEAIAIANDTNYGLSASIFTQDIDKAMKYVKEVDSGNIHVNWGPQWRADLMPYGGFKDSGLGKEGPRYAVEEMTELKMVVFHLGQ